MQVRMASKPMEENMWKYKIFYDGIRKKVKIKQGNKITQHSGLKEMYLLFAVQCFVCVVRRIVFQLSVDLYKLVDLSVAYFGNIVLNKSWFY